MYRRQVLAGTGTLTLVVAAGCLGSGDSTETEGDDDDPFDVDPEELLMSAEQAEDVLESEWDPGERLDEDDDRPLMYRDADVAQTILPFDGEEIHFEEGRIFNGVWLFDSVDDAREAYEDHPYYFGHGLEEETIAVESLAGEVETTDRVEWGVVLFRDANVVGGVSYRNNEMGEQERVEAALDLAATMHGAWRD